MNFIPWDVPIKAESHRSTDLKEFRFNQHILKFKLIEEDSEKVWELSFDSLQAFRLTTEECSAQIIECLPTDGGFFKSNNSTWLNSLRKNDAHFLKDASHFVICCYDEIIEIVAKANSPKFTKNDE